LNARKLLKSKNFDPLAYIESAFLDAEAKGNEGADKTLEELEAKLPTVGQFLNGEGIPAEIELPKKFRRTEMSAPRPRRARNTQKPDAIPPQLQQAWESLPKNIEFLCSFYDDAVTSNYYRGDFKETRQELIERLLNPELSLEETSRLLGVCPATVRRYTNRGWLTHHRTKGGQRRFRLTDVAKFVEEHGRFPEE
jgi:excisionase family DNA binding protein